MIEEVTIVDKVEHQKHLERLDSEFCNELCDIFKSKLGNNVRASLVARHVDAGAFEVFTIKEKTFLWQAFRWHYYKRILQIYNTYGFYLDKSFSSRLQVVVTDKQFLEEAKAVVVLLKEKYNQNAFVVVRERFYGTVYIGYLG